jgi:hypothetical protein
MKTIRRVSVALVCLLLVSYVGAKDKNITEYRVDPALDTEEMQYVLSHEREDVFKKGMQLEAKQSEVFWSVYHQYEKEKQQLDAKRLRLLGTYINKFSTLSNDEAVTLVKQSGSNLQNDLALRQKYFKILAQKLNPIVAARFVQLDDLIGMVTRIAILGNLPLIGVPAPEQVAPRQVPTSKTAPE